MFCIEVEGRAAGGIGLHPGHDVNRLTAELGYWLAEPFWGRRHRDCGGAGDRAPRLRVPAAESHRGLRLREQSCFGARALEKAGFTCEGRLRRSVIKDDQVLDSLVYARLRDEGGA